MNKKFKIKGFTLAEIMVVLVVLGVIAVVTVPALVNKHIESTNRTKIKKAMTVYDMALNKMVIENGIKDNKALYEDANSFAHEGNCTNTAPYFKVSTTLNNNPCTFKAPDGLFWNISKINAPILAFNEDDLNNADAENRFQLVGHFDNNGSLRIDDLMFEENNQNLSAYDKNNLEKLFSYIKNKKVEVYSLQNELNNFDKGEYNRKCTSEVTTMCLKLQKYSDNPNDKRLYRYSVEVVDSRGDVVYTFSDEDGAVNEYGGKGKCGHFAAELNLCEDEDGNYLCPNDPC